MQRIIGNPPSADNGDALAKSSLAGDGPCRTFAARRVRIRYAVIASVQSRSNRGFQGNEEIIERLEGRTAGDNERRRRFQKGPAAVNQGGRLVKAEIAQQQQEEKGQASEKKAMIETPLAFRTGLQSWSCRTSLWQRRR